MQFRSPVHERDLRLADQYGAIRVPIHPHSR
jgi:hypothetical protein